jgi:hypothetical protein
LKATQMHLQYVNQFENTTNSLPNLDFDNRSLQIRVYLLKYIY